MALTYFKHDALSINEGGIPNLHINFWNPGKVFIYICWGKNKRWWGNWVYNPWVV